MNQVQNSQRYDLEDRTANFAEQVIDVCKKAAKNVISSPIANQLVRAGTSIGANYREANGASSKKDFKNKIFICKKEAKETEYWLRMLARVEDSLAQECRRLWKESHELTLIFSAIGSKTK